MLQGRHFATHLATVAAAGALAALVGCNAIFGLDELTYGRGVGGGAAAGASGLGGVGGATPSGGGGTGNAGGASGGSTVGGAGGSGAGNGGGGAAGGACVPGPFSPPQNLAELNGTATDLDPWPTGDGLTLYFASTRSGAAGGYDTWVASRPSTASFFGVPVPLTEINTPYGDSAPAGTPDGLLLVFSSDRTGSTGESDLMFAVRQSAAEPFEPPVFLSELNSTAFDSDPTLTADGCLLCFSTDRSVGATGRDIWCATRDSPSDPFGAPSALAEVNSSLADTDPALSADGLTIFFTSERSGGLGEADIWLASRTSRWAPFGPATNATELNSTADEWSAALSTDGMTIYFASNRAGSVGQVDLWYATRSCNER